MRARPRKGPFRCPYRSRPPPTRRCRQELSEPFNEQLVEDFRKDLLSTGQPFCTRHKGPIPLGQQPQVLVKVTTTDVSTKKLEQLPLQLRFFNQSSCALITRLNTRIWQHTYDSRQIRSKIQATRARLCLIK